MQFIRRRYVHSTLRMSFLNQLQFDVNVRGVIFLSQAVVPHMKDGGRIINLSSIVARLAMPGSTGMKTLLSPIFIN